MRQKTFAAGDFERYRKPTRREQFLAEIDKVVPWDQLCERIEPFYPRPATVVRRLGWNGCCASTSSSTGSTCRIRVRKKPAMSRARCDALSALTWAGNRCRTRRRSSTSGICWSSMPSGRVAVSGGGQYPLRAVLLLCLPYQPYGPFPDFRE